jgi:hypothetical protein
VDDCVFLVPLTSGVLLLLDFLDNVRGMKNIRNPDINVLEPVSLIYSIVFALITDSILFKSLSNGPKRKHVLEQSLNSMCGKEANPKVTAKHATFIEGKFAWDLKHRMQYLLENRYNQTIWPSLFGPFYDAQMIHWFHFCSHVCVY